MQSPALGGATFDVRSAIDPASLGPRHARGSGRGAALRI